MMMLDVSEALENVKLASEQIESAFKDIKLDTDHLENNTIEIVAYRGDVKNKDTMLTSYIINISPNGHIGIIYGYSGKVVLNSINNLSGFLIQDIRRRLYEKPENT